MTCLKLMGSTVKEVTEALPSHSPSQRAVAQGKVHTYFYSTQHVATVVFALNHNSFLFSFSCQHQDCRGQVLVEEFLT